MLFRSEGKFHGHTIGYGNDLTLPVRQGKDFGKVLYTVDYVHGVKNGTAKFYRYSAMDNIGITDKKQKKKLEKYYFLHLEVPYRTGIGINELLDAISSFILPPASVSNRLSAYLYKIEHDPKGHKRSFLK